MRRMMLRTLENMDKTFNIGEFISKWIDLHGTVFAPTGSQAGNYLARADGVENIGAGRWRREDA